MDFKNEVKMPVRKVKGGFKIDNVDKVHKTKAGADRQLRAIKARQGASGKPKKK